MKYSIVLTRYAQGYVPVGTSIGVRLKIEATDPVGMTAHIFVHQRDGTADRFVHVATPYAIAAYPEDIPNKEGFSRKTTVDLVFRTEHEAEAAWNDIQQEVSDLLVALDAADALANTESVTITF